MILSCRSCDRSGINLAVTEKTIGPDIRFTLYFHRFILVVVKGAEGHIYTQKGHNHWKLRSLRKQGDIFFLSLNLEIA